MERDSKGRFGVGNRFWINVDFSGRGAEKIFSTPDDLEYKIKEYLEWLADNPIKQEEVAGKDAKIVLVNKMNAPTVEGFCAYSGIIPNTYYTYAKRPLFKDICSILDNVIFSINYSAAAAGVLNHAIVARKLGLVDKREVDNKNSQQVIFYQPTIEVVPLELKSGEDEKLIEDAEWSEF